MENIVNELAEQYAKINSSPLDKILQEVEDFTLQNHPQAQMLSGHVQGKLLQMISCMIKPHYVLEIGTFTGFSAICLSKGLQENGQLHTIELREDDANIANGFIKKANAQDKITVHIGDAKQIISTFNLSWDLVFIDADKTGYIAYYELILPKVKKGGFIIADNVLFHGDVFQQEIKGKNGKAIYEFNHHISNDKRVEQVMLTVRDGLLIIKKL